MALPRDFYWREYIALNKDLYHINKKEDAIKHYINHGLIEKREYKITKYNCLHLLPYDFDWKEYYLLKNNPKINKNKRDVFSHYLIYGRNKEYKIVKDKSDNSENNKVKKTPDKILLQKNDNNNNNNDNDNVMNSSNLLNKNKKKYEIIGNYDKYHEDANILEKITYNEENFDFLNENEIIRTKVDNEKYLEFESDINILNILPNFFLIIDTNNMESKDCFFINSIVSKYKTYATFLILRFDQEKYFFNINDEYLIDQFFFEIDDVIKVLDDKKEKINKIFVNSFISYSEKFINYILDLSIPKIGTTSDFFKIYKDSLTFYNYIDSKSKIDINKFDQIINPNNYNYNMQHYSTFYHKQIQIVQFPYFYNKLKKYKTNNKEIVCCFIGNITDSKGKLEFESIILHFSEIYRTIKFVLIGTVDSSIRIDSQKYENITDLNNLLKKYNPNILIELSNYNSNYSNTLQLSILTELPIIYSKKTNNTYFKETLNNYNKAYEFETMDSLFYLINKHSQDYFYTILPTISYNKYWHNLFVIDKENLIINNEMNKYNIKPYFIYYPQYHEINENNVIHYKSHNDLKEINYYNEKNTMTLDVPQKQFYDSKIYDYIVNDKLIQNQIDFIDKLNFSGIAVYYYWFIINSITNKNMIMEDVINKLFSSDINMYDKKIFFIWKNENLSNLYNCGLKIIENVYNNNCFNKNGECLINYFKNDKYLKIDNKPVFVIGDSEHISNYETFYDILNKLCVENGFSGIHLVVNTNTNNENITYKNCEINFNIYKINNTKLLEFKNDTNELNYEKFVNNEYGFSSKKIHTITFDFNNSSNIKKQIKIKHPFICKNNTQMNKVLYTKKIIEFYNKSLQSELDKILLINSLNNWGEGNAFEPSEKYGYYNINLLNQLIKY